MGLTRPLSDGPVAQNMTVCVVRIPKEIYLQKSIRQRFLIFVQSKHHEIIQIRWFAVHIGLSDMLRSLLLTSKDPKKKISKTGFCLAPFCHITSLKTQRVTTYPCVPTRIFSQRNQIKKKKHEYRKN